MRMINVIKIYFNSNIPCFQLIFLTYPMFNTVQLKAEALDDLRSSASLVVRLSVFPLSLSTVAGKTADSANILLRVPELACDNELVRLQVSRPSVAHIHGHHTRWSIRSLVGTNELATRN